jgi:hypothetical protein
MGSDKWGQKIYITIQQGETLKTINFGGKLSSSNLRPFFPFS